MYLLNYSSGCSVLPFSIYWFLLVWEYGGNIILIRWIITVPTKNKVLWTHTRVVSGNKIFPIQSSHPESSFLCIFRESWINQKMHNKTSTIYTDCLNNYMCTCILNNVKYSCMLFVFMHVRIQFNLFSNPFVKKNAYVVYFKYILLSNDFCLPSDIAFLNH